MILEVFMSLLLNFVIKLLLIFLFLFLFNSIFISYLFYLNPKLLRMEKEIKGDGEGHNPLSGIFISNLKWMAKM